MLAQRCATSLACHHGSMTQLSFRTPCPHLSIGQGHAFVAQGRSKAAAEATQQAADTHSTAVGERTLARQLVQHSSTARGPCLAAFACECAFGTQRCRRRVASGGVGLQPRAQGSGCGTPRQGPGQPCRFASVGRWLIDCQRVHSVVSSSGFPPSRLVPLIVVLRGSCIPH